MIGAIASQVNVRAHCDAAKRRNHAGRQFDLEIVTRFVEIIEAGTIEVRA